MKNTEFMSKKIVLILINNEIRNKNVLSATASITDTCSSAPGSGTDICPFTDTSDCKQWAHDYCKYIDRAACAGVGNEDLCDYDYASGGFLCDPRDTCEIDLI